MSKVKAWIVSMRLRTLPLALSSIFMGSVTAAHYGMFRADILLWASLTTLFLQILSNLANDFGDAKSGADNENRVGPRRMIQSGMITLGQMKIAMIIFVLLSLVSGITLLIKAFEKDHIKLLAFFLLGIAAIIAAIRYTAGKNPYGYRGLGDIYVFLFFGLVGVAGSFYLHANVWHWEVLLPAATIGLFSTGVLNLNNIRDRESDIESGKRTMAVKLGDRYARQYHMALLGDGWILFLIFVMLSPRPICFLPVFGAMPIFIRHAAKVWKNENPALLDNELRNLSLSTLLFVALCALSLVF